MLSSATRSEGWAGASGTGVGGAGGFDSTVGAGGGGGSGRATGGCFLWHAPAKIASNTTRGNTAVLAARRDVIVGDSFFARQARAASARPVRREVVADPRDLPQALAVAADREY